MLDLCTVSQKYFVKPAEGKFHAFRGAFLLICGAVVLWLIASFLKPLLMGAIFAAVLYPFMLRLAKWRVSDAWKAGLVTLAFSVAFLLPIGILIFLGVQAALEHVEALQATSLSNGTVPFSMKGVLEFMGLQSFVDKVADWLPISDAAFQQLMIRVLKMGGTLLTTLLQRFVADLPVSIFSTIVVLFTIFYLLIDGRRAVQFIRENSFFSQRRTDQLLSGMQSLCYSVVVATIVAGAVQSALVVLAMTIAGAENKALVGLITFIASFLPLIGTAPVTLFLVLQALFAGDSSGAVIYLVFWILVSVSDNLVRPYVLKGGANLHPLVGFVAAFGALDTIGFYGLFIGPVVAGMFFQVLPIVTKSYPRQSSLR